MKRYNTLGRPRIMFSAEANCFPPQFCTTHPPPPIPVSAKYINTGGVIGRAGALTKFWGDMEGRETIVNDQVEKILRSLYHHNVAHLYAQTL